MSNLSRLSLLFALLLAPACTVGEVIGGPAGGDDTDVGGDDEVGLGPDGSVADPEEFSVSMTPLSITTTLGTTSHYSLALQSDNFAGPVTLAATGVPAGATVTFTPPAPTLTLDGSVTVDVAIVINTEFIAGTSTIGIDATATPGLRSASGQYVVTPDYILDITPGTGGGAHPFPGTLRLPLGTELHIRNLDTAGHRIHSDGGLGFAHQGATMPQGAEYAMTPGEAASYTFYCHDHNVGSGVTNLVVQ
jgi:hypothetical protein